MAFKDLRRRRFSTIYAAPEGFLKDSPLLRKRLARRCFRFIGEYHASQVSQEIEDELGIRVSYPTTSIYKWERAFNEASMPQVLSAVTEIRRILKAPIGSSFDEAEFYNEINRIFQEEASAFYVDEQGVVHPKPDEAYRLAYTSTIRGLNEAGLEAAAEEIKKSDNHLLDDPPDWSRAVYSTFMACENIFKLLTHAERLTGHLIRDHLKPLLEARYSSERDTTKNFQEDLLNTFYPWVKACHNYRHSDGDTLSSQPPEELALLAVSNGYNHVRWLADLYQHQQRQ